MGDHRRSRSGKFSRRNLLASGFIAIGGGLLLTDSGAFSQIAATRQASVGVSADDGALLGLDTVDVAGVGVDTDLLSVTNNTADQLTATMDLANSRAGESIDPTQISLLQNESKVVVASLDVNRATDGKSIDINIVGSGSGIDIELTRTVPVPSFAWQVFDNSLHGNIQFDVSYSISNVPHFNSIEINVYNDNTDELLESYERATIGGSVTYPRSGRDRGAGSTEYKITFDAYDGEVGPVLHKEVLVTGGESAGEGNPGSEDDPRLDWVFVDDLTNESTDDVEYAVYYQVSNLENFGEVEVKFDHESDWATKRTTTIQNPIGMVKHERGNAGHNFDIILRVKNDSGATVTSETRSDIANGENPSNPDTAEPDSPTFATLEVLDVSSNKEAEYIVNYTVDNEGRFGEVRARFENLSGGPETNETIADSSGTLTYSTGYTGGHEYRITIRIFEERSGVLIPVEKVVYTDVADGEDP